MRQYVVQAGDSPASISAKLGGCPKCARDLVAANGHKQSAVHPNGFISFKDLRVGETLNLPEIWEGENDKRPVEYFKSLPYADGVTHGVGMACQPQPRMRTVADAMNDGSFLSAPAQETDSKLNLGAVFVGGLLVASAIGGIIELRRRA